MMNQTSRKPRNWDGSMRFGLFWPKARTMLPSARMASLNPDPLDLNVHLDLVRACETVGLDLVLLGDGYAPSSEEGSSYGFQDPSMHAIVLAAPLIQATSHLGIISTMHTQFFHPAQIARFGAHFDWLSGGRWGWNIVNGYRDYESSLFGFDRLLDSASLYDAAEDAVHIVEEVWGAKGKVDYTGKHFSSRGKMRGPFPPERPVFVCAAASERGQRFTAKYCDYLFASPASLADLPGLQTSLAAHAAEGGRARPPETLVVADLLVRDEPGLGTAMMEELMGSIQGDSGKRWAEQMAVLRKNPSTPSKFPAFAGTPTEVAEQILTARDQYGLNGILFRLPVWSAEEMLRVGPVFDLLAKAGVWTPPAQRGHGW